MIKVTTHKQRPPSAGGALLLMIFALPFAAFGGFAAYRTGLLLWTWQEAKDWTEVQARILDLELEKHSDGEGGGTWEVHCTYAYTFEGTAYRADRVGIETEADNIGPWQKDTHRRLEQRRARGQTVICFVDPSHPQRALLSRELRPSMLGIWLAFSMVFLTAGLGLFAAGVHTASSAAKQRRLRRAHPDQPWMWKEDWAKAHLPAGTMFNAILLWALAIFSNGITAPIIALVIFPAVVDGGHYWAILFLIFPLVGLALLYGAIRATLQHLKFGRSHFLLTTLPGQVGGRLRGNLILIGKLHSVQAVELSLRCDRVTSTGSGKNRCTSTDTLWKQTDKKENLAIFSGNRLSVPVDFQIPPNSPPTDTSQPLQQVKWILQATAETPGVDLDLNFDVPVFRTKATPPAA